MGQIIFQVDAFTDKPFAGNPAGVCLLPGPVLDEWMQHVASEMNVSETAFLYPQGDGFNLRWFTPTVEVDLCGHATLASAHVLWETGMLHHDRPALFDTRSGRLSATSNGESIEMAFPAEPEQQTPEPPGLAQALGCKLLYVGRNRMDYLVEVESEEALRGIRPDFTRLAQIDSRGFIVTSRSDSGSYDFVSRFFAPRVGVNEDPVTGSSHCCLGPFWASRLNKAEMTAYQASARGGVVGVRVGDDKAYISGQAVTVFHAELRGQAHEPR